MAYDVALKLPTDNLNLAMSTADNWKKGVITLINQANLPLDALAEANNLTLVELGQPKPRSGVGWYGNAVPNGAAIDGAFPFENSDGTVHLIAVAGGVVYRSLDNATTWTAVTGATLTAGSKAYFEQASGYLFVFNATDNTVRYDGTLTLQIYSSLSAPAAPTFALTGLAAGGYTYYYRASYVNAVGFTQGSVSGSFTCNRPRSQWNSTNYVTVSVNGIAGASRIDFYITDNSQADALNQLSYVGSVGVNGVGAQTYSDQGTDLINTNISVPVQNTTTGPVCGDGTYIGSRLWLTRDKDNKYRVWWSGAGPYLGYFSTAYDGGYIDLQKGGAFFPIKAVDYRDGKGNQLTTVFCRSRDGRGCIWQISLGSLTVANTSITVPSAYKLPGSRGSDAPNSVVNVLNDYLYWNTNAPGIFNLGSRAQFLNLLSTDEATANVRPNCVSVNPAAAAGIAGVFWRAKVYFSVPYGSTTNNATMMYDTERKCWLPYAFTIGFERFMPYGATDNTQHLLCWKPGDNRLSEIGESIQGDYGVPFATSLITGLFPTTKDRFSFLWTEEAEMEFSQPKGSISVELNGIERNRGYRSLKVATIAPRTTNVGWSSFPWSTKAWSDTSVVPATYSENSIKRYFNVQRELNAYQYHITSRALDADYILRTLQINGTPTNAGKPRQWLLT